MAATVKIDFAIGDTGLATRMARTVSQAVEREARASARAQLAIQKEVAKGELAIARDAAKARAQAEMQALKAAAQAKAQDVKHFQALQQAQLKSGLAATTAAHRAQLASARETMRQELALAKTTAQERAAITKAQIAAQTRERIAAARQVARQQTRQAVDEDRAVRSTRGAFSGVIGAGARGLGEGVRTVAGGVMRIGGALAGGAGLQVGLQHAMAQKVAQESLAVDIVNSATMGHKDVGQRVAEAKAVGEQARTTGQKFAIDPTQILEGVQQFVSFTGDLEGAKQAMDSLAELSSATGTDFGQLSAAAGSLNGKLAAAGGPFADAATRAKAVSDTMRILAAQGKVGGIEIRDLVSGLGSVGGLAGLYAGDRTKSIANLGTLAQISVQGGTAGNAAEAFTAARSFTATFSKRARRKELKSLGIETEDAQGNLLDPKTIIKNAISATGGDKQKLFGRAFMDVRSQAPIQAALAAYKGAGGGKEGLAAIDKLFEPFEKAALTEAEVREANAARMSTDASKAQQAQQQIDQALQKAAEKFIALAPSLDRVLSGFLSIVEWTSSHPFATAGAAVMGSLVKSIAGQVIGNMSVSAGVVNVTGGPVPPPGGPVPPGGAAAGVLGKVGAVAAGAGIGITGGIAISGEIDKDLAKRGNAPLEAFNVANRIGTRGEQAGDRARAQALLAQMQGEQQEGTVSRFFSNATAGVRGLASGDFSLGNVASAIPIGALGRGIVGTALENQQENSDRLTPTAINDLKAALEKPQQLAPGAQVQAVITNVAEIANAMPKGRDPNAQPMTDGF